MKILLTNDDGIHADGLWVLHDALAGEHRVTVVAPDRERSAVGHGITLHHPLRVAEVAVRDGLRGQAVDGTPADCVKLGLSELLLEDRPDLVVAGINPGANVGVSINYSGTVSAAREAALYGVPGLAVSVNGFPGGHLEDCAGFIARLAGDLARRPMPFGTFLNVNVPDLPAGEIPGARITRQGVSPITEYFEKRVDPRNRTYHWLGGDTQRFEPDLAIDWSALSEGYISITPIKCDMTDYALLGDLESWVPSERRRWRRG